MPKTSHHCRPSSTTPPADVTGYSVKQLTRLSAEVLCLHLASRHLITSGSKAIMAKRLYDVLHPSSTTKEPPAPAPLSHPSTASHWVKLRHNRRFHLETLTRLPTNGPIYKLQCCMATRTLSATFISDGPISIGHYYASRN